MRIKPQKILNIGLLITIAVLILGFLLTDSAFSPQLTALLLLAFLAYIASWLAVKSQQKEENEYLLISQLPLAVAMFDNEMRYLEYSEVWKEMYRFPEETNLRGRLHYEVFPEIGQEWKAVHRRALQGETISAVEDRFERADGGFYYLNWECKPWYNHKGIIAGIIIWSQDVTSQVTERIQSKINLHHSEAKFHILYLQSPNPSFIIDLNHDFLIEDCNIIAVNILGFKKTDILKKRFLDFCSATQPDGTDSEQFLKYTKTAFLDNGGTPYTFEFAFTNATGNLLWVSISLAIVHFANELKCMAIWHDISERKLAEIALKESEQKLNAAFSNAAIGFAIANASGHIIQVNTSLCEILDYPVEDLIGHVFSQFTHPDDVAAQAAKLKQLTTGELTSLKIENRFIRKDGSIVWARKSISVIHEEDGSVKYFILLAEDITARKQAELALLESEEKFKTLYNSSPDAYLICDLEDQARILDCNAAAEQLLRGTKKQIIGLTPLDLSPQIQPDGTKSKESLKKNAAMLAANRDTKLILEHVHKRLDGEEFWASVTVGSIDYKDKMAALVVWRDISKRKKTEAELKQSEQKFRQLFDFAPDAFFLMDAESKGAIISCNKKAQELLQATEEQIIGKTPLDFSPPFQPDGTASGEAILKKIKEIKSSNVSKDFDFLHCKRNGDTFWASVSVGLLEGESSYEVVVWRDITDRKKAEEEIRQSELKFKALFDRSPLGILIMDLDDQGRILDCNLETENILRANRDFILGKTPLDFSPPFQADGTPSPQAVVEKIGLVLSQPEQKTSFEFLHQRADGENFHALVSVNMLSFYGKNTALITWIDINNIKEAEQKILNYQQELQTEARRNKLLLQTASDGIHHLDLNGNIIQCSDAFAAMLGYTVEEVLLLKLTDIDKEITEEQMHQIIQRLSQEDALMTFTGKHTRKDGTKIDVEINAQMVTIEGEKLIYASSRDIGTRLLAEKKILDYQSELLHLSDELQKKVSFQKTLIESSPEAIVSGDLQGLINMFNPAAERLLGYTAEEIIGKQTPLIFHDQKELEDRAHYLSKFVGHPIQPNFEVFATPLVNGAENKKEWTFIHKNGSKFPVLLTVSPQLNDQKEIIGYLGIVRDISEIKKTETALLQYQKELEEIKKGLEMRIAERTAQLERQQSQLEEQNIELQKTNEELDRFVYSTSHDLRAPLSSLLGLINIIELETDSANHSLIFQIDMMKKMVNKLDSFIRDILDYSRNMRLEINRDEITFSELIRQVEERLEFMDGFVNIKIEKNINQNAIFVTDKKRMEIIFNNLISNAVKYSDPTKTEAWIKIGVDNDEKEAVITIEDNGIGIAEELQEKVFEMFFRGTNASTGSGIGLYIVKETVEKIGGSIKLESELHKGSRFTVKIPNSNF